MFLQFYLKLKLVPILLYNIPFQSINIAYIIHEFKITVALSFVALSPIQQYISRGFYKTLYKKKHRIVPRERTDFYIFSSDLSRKYRSFVEADEEWARERCGRLQSVYSSHGYTKES